MSDDIFIKHGLGSFQQPYNARQPSNAQEPNIRAQQEPNIRNVQEPNIRAQQEPNIRQAREPSTYNHRSPTTYNHRSPSTYQHRSPGITQTTYQSRQPLTYNHRSPSEYRHPIIYQHPSIYIHRIPYIATGREPNIRSRQNAYPYIANNQEPNIRGHQQPTIKDAREPNIVSAQEPNIRNKQSPFTYNHRSPFTYARQGQTPSTYDHRSPFTFPNQGQTPTTYDHRSPFTYARQGQTPTTYDHRSPSTYNRTGSLPYNWVDDITSAYAYGYDQQEDGADAEASIQVICKYASGTGRLEAWVQTSCAPVEEQSHSSSTLAFYINASDHTIADGAYTVKFTQTAAANNDPYGETNLDGDDGSSTITASATTVPTNVNTKFFSWEVTATAGGNDEEDEIADFTLNLIFEHSSLPTITYACDWSMMAHAVSENSQE